MLGFDFKLIVYYIYNNLCLKYVLKFKFKYKLGVEIN